MHRFRRLLKNLRWWHILVLCIVVISAVGAPGLARLDGQLQALKAKICKDGECDIDPDNLPNAEMSALQSSLTALPAEWAKPKLFPVATELTLAAGQSVAFHYPKNAGDSRVLSGSIHASAAGGSLQLCMVVTGQCRDDDGNRTDQALVCSQTLPGSAADSPRATEVAVMARTNTFLLLTCKAAGNCGVGLGALSANLPSNGQCDCKQRNHKNDDAIQYQEYANYCR